MASFMQILLLASCIYSLKAIEDFHRSQSKMRRERGPTVGKQSNKTLAHFHRMNIEKIEKGTYTDDYRIFYRSARGPISPLHDIPLYSDYNKHIVNMIVETPAWTNEKMQIKLAQPLNPITKGINNLGFITNYGALPQTWQNPNQNDTFTGQKGDGNPLDVFDIGRKTFKAGDIIQVKVLAVMGFNYAGKTNWKIIGLHVDDPRAPEIHNVEGIRKHFTGILKTIINWYTAWLPNENITLFEEAKDTAFAYNVIADCNKQWIHLMEGKVKAPQISLLNTYIKGSEGRVSFATAEEELNKQNYPSGAPTSIWGPYDDRYIHPNFTTTCHNPILGRIY
uniref:inorganic diphosphatase n=1 Tax=Cacopsylla melanoneura TaxID=428564 RepID=A0A8D8YKM6_9HEMI